MLTAAACRVASHGGLQKKQEQSLRGLFELNWSGSRALSFKGNPNPHLLSLDGWLFVFAANRGECNISIELFSNQI